MTSRHKMAAALAWFGVGCLALAASLHVGLLSWIFARRVTYPLDLEWMEGGMLCHGLRVLSGEPLYGPPSVEFISYLYTPFYPYLLAAAGKVFGLSYLVGRSISLLGFAVATTVLIKVVLRECSVEILGRFGRYAFALLGVGLFFASFPHTGAWYDLVRNDSVYLGLLTSALYLLRYHHHSWLKVALAGVLLGLGFLTKQTTSVFILFAGASMMLINWRRLLVLVPAVGLVAGGVVLLGNYATDGWMWRYIFELHQGHDLRADWLWPKTQLRLLRLMPAIAAVLAAWVVAQVVVLATTRRMPCPDRRRRIFWFVLTVIGVVVSAIGFSTQWAVENAFIPGFYFAALFTPLALSELMTLAARLRPGFSATVSLVFGAALVWQLVSSLYSPTPHLPSARSRQAVKPLLRRLAQQPGPLLMPYHPFYPHLVGKGVGYHQMGINDVTRAGYPIPPTLRQRFAKQYYGAVVLDSSPVDRRDYGILLRHYKFAHYFHPAEAPDVVTGYRVRPRYLLVPKRPAPPAPAGAHRIFDFESGDYGSWQIVGRAFGRRPAGGDRGNQLMAGPFSGRYLASSYVNGDNAIGRLISPAFRVEGRRLTFRLGGGRDKDRLFVRLMVNGREVHRATGDRTHIMRVHRVDVAQYRGQSMHLELVDQSVGGWGHLLFDELVLRH